MSTVLVIADGGETTRVDITAGGYTPPHPEGALPVRIPVAAAPYMQNGTTATVPFLTLATRNGCLTVESVEGTLLVNQGTGDPLAPPPEYDVVTTPSPFQVPGGPGAVPSVNPLHYGKALSVDGGLLAVHGPLEKSFFGYGEGAATLTFFSTGNVTIPGTELKLGRSNQRSSFAGQ